MRPVEPLFGGMLWGVVDRVRDTYTIVRGVGARTRIYTRSGETRDARVTILKRNGAIRLCLRGGLESRVPLAVAVTLARGGVPFALDQLPTGSFTGRLGQTGTASTPWKSRKSQKHRDIAENEIRATR